MKLFLKSEAESLDPRPGSLNEQRKRIRRLIEIHPEFAPATEPAKDRVFATFRPGLRAEIIPFPKR
jgi:hypothetical protein